MEDRVDKTKEEWKNELTPELFADLSSRQPLNQ